MKNILFIAAMAISISLSSQSFINITEYPTCDQSCTGYAEIKISEELLDPDMLPPFEVYLVNISTHQTFTFFLNGYREVISALCPGEYEINLHLSEYCNWIGNVQIQSVSEIPLNINLNYLCNGSCIDLSVQNKQGDIEVSWFKLVQSSYILVPGWPKYNLPGGDGQEDLCNIAEAGRYKVVVYDAACGVSEATLRMDPCSCLSLDLINVQNVTSCKGAEPDLFPPTPPYQACDGALSVYLNTTLPVQYRWSNGMTGSSIHNLCTGVYTVTATAGACTIIRDFEICCCYAQFGDPPFNLCYDNNASQTMNIQATPSSPNSSNASDGYILISVRGGSAVKSYSWSGPNGFTSFSKDIDGLVSGDYFLTVSDGCTSTEKYVKLVNCANHDYQISSTIIPACFNGGKGVLRLNKPANVTIAWDDI